MLNTPGLRGFDCVTVRHLNRLVAKWSAGTLSECDTNRPRLRYISLSLRAVPATQLITYGLQKMPN